MSGADDPIDRMARARQELRSYTDEEETSQVKTPSDAPVRAKVWLAVYAGLPPYGRVLVVLALIAALFFGGAELGHRLGWW